MPDKQPFPVRFSGKLRPSQTAAAAVAAKTIREGRRGVYLVAPPGSGKTVLGLYLWAEHVKRPAVVLSPNSAIQAQWAARIDLFAVDGSPEGLVSTDPQQPGLLTSLTYQSLTIPRRGDENLDRQAIDLWQDRLVEKGEAKDPAEAEVWIEDLRLHNPDYFQRRLATYRKEIRDRMAQGGQSLDVLHESALASLQRLRDRGVELMIVDECHHLLGHWGRVLADAKRLLGDPMVIGLTATPPDTDGKPPEDLKRFEDFLGPIAYETPLPAVVKDGFLAPYQDLVYLVRPRAEEYEYLCNVDRQMKTLIESLCQPQAESQPATQPPATPLAASTAQPQQAAPRSLCQWLKETLAERRLPTGAAKDWGSFERRDPEFATSARHFLLERGESLPEGVPPPPARDPASEGGAWEIVVPVLDRYVRHRLLRSADPSDHALADAVTTQLRLLGMQITETGPRPCASPVDRVMAYSRSKADAILPILKAERAVLGDGLRAVVIADYEKTSANSDVSELLDEEAGGAIAAFRALLSDPETDALDPVLLTGSTVLVDDDLSEMLIQQAAAWLEKHKCDIRLNYEPRTGFGILSGEGEGWCPRVYVRMITDLFQSGVTKCLVGTRGLLGEGWDSPKVNVLISLSAATTSMTVNQLHGRSIRLDADDPAKLADNWEVVCIAPELTKGLEDLRRFIDRHRTLFGLTDDGVIEKGVGHVHAAFTELRPEGLEGAAPELNQQMLARAGKRKAMRELWKIGQPFQLAAVHAVEKKPSKEGRAGGFPPFRKAHQPWDDRSLCASVGAAVLGALVEAGLVSRRGKVQCSERAGGYVRIFLEQASEEESQLFAQSLGEALGPLDRPRYVIPRLIDDVRDTWYSRVFPEWIGKHLRRRDRRFVALHAVPAALAKNRELAEMYARWWNAYVSPGQTCYAYQGEGADLLQRSLQAGLAPQEGVCDKEIFPS